MDLLVQNAELEALQVWEVGWVAEVLRVLTHS